MLDAIRKYFWNAEIQKKLPKVIRSKQIIHPSAAKSIGILYKVGEEKDYLIVTDFFSRLQNEKKEVRTLGWINLKDPPHYCYPRLMYDYITKRNINWFGKPSGEKINDFINKDFDILLNIDTSDNPSLTYAAALSKARLKVGKYSEKNKDYYDLMISLDKPPEVTELIEQMMTNIAMFANKTIRQEV
ncbi:MAG TPA: hypothetical protein PKW80_14205 [Bacteroidales bacterium]|nr:hypothetical protein [Bacteroidales bacterium]